MTSEELRRFFLWCSIVNTGMLAIAFLVCASAGDFVYALHGRWFPMPRETFTLMLYGFLGLYKILVIVFNIVPYIALCIVGRRRCA